jgi:hypothetical protein
MANIKSKQNPYFWPDGSWHSISYSQHQINLAKGHTGPVGDAALNSVASSVAEQPAPPTPTPVEPGPVAPTPQPIDPALLNAQLIGNRNVAVSKGESAYQLGNLGFDYGLNPDDTVNTANPYSRAALYQLAHERQRLGNTNSYAAQGQLYSGALQNAQGESDRLYGINDATNRLAYQRAVHGVQTGQLGVVANAGTGVSDTDFQALLKATYPGS